jgi:hypothetical protein
LDVCGRESRGWDWTWRIRHGKETWQCHVSTLRLWIARESPSVEPTTGGPWPSGHLTGVRADEQFRNCFATGNEIGSQQPSGVGGVLIFEKQAASKWQPAISQGRLMLCHYCDPSALGLGLDGPSSVQAPCKGRARAAQAPSKGRFWELLCLQQKTRKCRVGSENRVISWSGYRDIG